MKSNNIKIKPTISWKTGELKEQERKREEKERKRKKHRSVNLNIK